MLEKLDISDGEIISALKDEYGLTITQLTFLPLGADPDAAVYRVKAVASGVYFLKVKRGNNKVTATLPKFLKDQGIRQVLAPLATKANDAWVRLGNLQLILYPFIEGKNGFELSLQAQQWISFGATLSQLHAVALPPRFDKEIPRESFSPTWRHRARKFLAQTPPCNNDAAEKLLALLQSKADEIQRMVRRADELASILRGQPLEYVLCHADIHAGNLLITAEGELYLVDWDNPVLAPKERDLMFIGGGVGGSWNQAAETALFYQGYGDAEINSFALSYYRYERIVEDIVVTCEELFSTDGGGDNRNQSLRFLENQFLADDVVATAHKTYETLG